MKKSLPEITATRIRVLAYYEILGSIFGAILFFFALFNLESYSFQLIALLAVPGIFIAFSLYCGLLLLKHTTVLRGLQLSKINQAFQLVTFSVLGITFSYVSGFGFLIGLNIGYGIKIGSSIEVSKLVFDFSSRFSNQPIIFELNIVALLLYVFIYRTYRKLKAQLEQEKTILSDIDESY